MTVPAAAREMVPLMRPTAPDRGRAAIAEEVAERTRQGRGRTGVDNILNAEVQLWWLDEWARPDGLYGVRELTEHEQDRYEQFMRHIPGAGFIGAGNDREVLGALPDAQIVCETLAIDGHLLLTHDTQTMKPENLFPWTRRLAEAGWISQPHVVEEADVANVRWVHQQPEDMLLGTILCAWPKEAEAGPGDIRTQIDDVIARLAAAGLPDTSTELDKLVRQNSNNLGPLVEMMNRELPVDMRNAERRSPYLSWQGPQENPRGTRFQTVWTGAVIMLLHRSMSGNVHKWAEWGRDELDAMETFLAERNIGIEGLPTPTTSSGGGFVRAIGRAIDEMEHSRGHD